MKRVLIGSLLALVLGACASMGRHDMPASASNGMLVSDNGMTLYTFDRDPAGGAKSLCNAQCAANWPALKASTDASMGDYSVLTRDDGSKQWAYKGKPLYYWAKDQKPGDRTGDGVGGVWHIARP